MASNQGTRVLRAVGRFLNDVIRSAASSPRIKSTPSGCARSTAHGGSTSLTSPGSVRGSETVEVEPPAAGALVLSYEPDTDGDPDAGEVIWTWVPYAENDGRGKDRPVLVIGRHGQDRVFAVRLTSKAHEGDRDFFAIGSGPWDSQGRPSWVDLDQVYSVHRDGMRREASALDLERFTRVAQALQQRYGWEPEGSSAQSA